MHTVQTLTGSRFKKLGIVKKTDEKRKSKGTNRMVSVYQYLPEAVQPIISKQSEASPPAESSKTPKKVSKKQKVSSLPEEITATGLGESIIEYINNLQDRIGNLALTLKENIEKSKMSMGYLKKQIHTLTYQNDGLKKANADLTKKLANKSRTFNTKDVVDFQNRKGARSGYSHGS